MFVSPIAKQYWLDIINNLSQDQQHAMGTKVNGVSTIRVHLQALFARFVNTQDTKRQQEYILHYANPHSYVAGNGRTSFHASLHRRELETLFRDLRDWFPLGQTYDINPQQQKDAYYRGWPSSWKTDFVTQHRSIANVAVTLDVIENYMGRRIDASLQSQETNTERQRTVAAQARDEPSSRERGRQPLSNGGDNFDSRGDERNRNAGNGNGNPRFQRRRDRSPTSGPMSVCRSTRCYVQSFHRWGDCPSNPQGSGHMVNKYRSNQPAEEDSKPAAEANDNKNNKVASLSVRPRNVIDPMSVCRST